MFESSQLQQDLDARELPPPVRTLIQGALPTLPSHRHSAQGKGLARQVSHSRAVDSPGLAGSPWALPIEEQMTGLIVKTVATVPHMLEGAVRVQRWPLL